MKTIGNAENGCGESLATMSKLSGTKPAALGRRDKTRGPAPNDEGGVEAQAIVSPEGILGTRIISSLAPTENTRRNATSEKRDLPMAGCEECDEEGVEAQAMVSPEGIPCTRLIMKKGTSKKTPQTQKSNIETPPNKTLKREGQQFSLGGREQKPKMIRSPKCVSPNMVLGRIVNNKESERLSRAYSPPPAQSVRATSPTHSARSGSPRPTVHSSTGSTHSRNIGSAQGSDKFEIVDGEAEILYPTSHSTSSTGRPTHSRNIRSARGLDKFEIIDGEAENLYPTCPAPRRAKTTSSTYSARSSSPRRRRPTAHSSTGFTGGGSTHSRNIVGTDPGSDKFETIDGEAENLYPTCPAPRRAKTTSSTHSARSSSPRRRRRPTAHHSSSGSTGSAHSRNLGRARASVKYDMIDGEDEDMPTKEMLQKYEKFEARHVGGKDYHEEREYPEPPNAHRRRGKPVRLEEEHEDDETRDSFDDSYWQGYGRSLLVAPSESYDSAYPDVYEGAHIAGLLRCGDGIVDEGINFLSEYGGCHIVIVPRYLGHL